MNTQDYSQRLKAIRDKYGCAEPSLAIDPRLSSSTLPIKASYSHDLET